MKFIILIAILVFLIVNVTLSGHQKARRPWSSYTEAEEVCATLYHEKNYAEAIRMLQLALEDFPEKFDEIIWSLAVNHNLNNEPEQALAALERAHARNVVFPDPPFYNYWKELETFPRFKEIRAQNTRMREQERRNAKPVWEILRPKDDQPDRGYPLFIVLHGWGGNSAWMKRYWKSPRLEKEFLVAFMQSSQLVQSNGYSWDDPDLARREIAAMYREISTRFPVDENRIYVGGFSQGGKTSLDLSFSNEIPISGFVLLCPGGGIPASLQDPAARQRATMMRRRTARWDSGA